MRLSEMTDEQLIKQVEDDALAREIFNRLVLSKLRVSDEVQALEHQRDKAQGDYEKAMDQVSALEVQVADANKEIAAYKDECGRNQRQIKQLILAAPSGKVAIHNSIIERDMSKVSLHWYTEERHGYEGWFLCVEEFKS